MRWRTRVTFRQVLLWAMGLLLVAYLLGLVFHDHLSSVLVDGWLGLGTSWMPVALCWLVVWRVGFHRRVILLVSAAMTVSTVGDTYYAAVVSTAGSVPFPSPADAAYLMFYVLLLAALAVVVRQQAREVASSVWLDCAVGSLGAAAVLAVVLRPVFESTLTGSLSLATTVAAAYPLFDLVMVAAVAGIAVLGGVRVGGRWTFLVLGLLVYAAADVAYGLQVSNDTYVVGTPLDAAWGLGLALMALWVDGSRRPVQSSATTRVTAARATALVVPAGATAAALGVLLISSLVPLSHLAVALAGVTLLGGAARVQVALRQLAQMAHLRQLEATTDPLTGLLNRRALSAEVHERLGDRSRCRALLLLDLDKFKEVNDSLGHHVGDLLLVQVGERVGEQLRPGDVLARLGGDEFAVLLEDSGHPEAAAVAAKIHNALAGSFVLEGVALHSAVSIGIALFPGDGPDLSTLLRKADIAMYKAKNTGDGVHFYGTGDHTDGAARLRTVEELRTAMATDQLVLHYQPKIDLDTGSVRGVEALVRWDHPTRGLLYPDAFLALAGEAGLMRPLTHLVLEVALDQAATWQEQGRHLTIAVNLSASSLVDADLPEQVAAMLHARGLPPSALQLEITEEFLMADRDRARIILTRLRENGVQISVDDFGTGYSSLSYLRDLPIDELKLDRSFVFPMVDDARAGALVASTIALAHSLGLRMVAEGVETHVAYTELTRLGCDQAQGYLMSRPVPAAELEHWLSNRHADGDLTDRPHPLPIAAIR